MYQPMALQEYMIELYIHGQIYFENTYNTKYILFIDKYNHIVYFCQTI